MEILKIAAVPEKFRLAAFDGAPEEEAEAERFRAYAVHLLDASDVFL